MSYTALVCPTVIGTDPNNLPVLLIGGSAGQLTGRRHIRYVTPMASLLVSVMDKLGVPVDKIGNSTGKVPIEPVPTEKSVLVAAVDVAIDDGYASGQ